MSAKNFISVICPIYNEKEYITGCFESILAQDYPFDLIEVLFIDGISNDNTREIIMDIAHKYSFVKLLDNPSKIVPFALNIGIIASVGDVIIRMDAHCKYPVNYFSILIDSLNKLNADNVGGVILTKPANSSAIAKAIAITMSHPFGVGNSLFRIGCKKIMQVDTVPFGCFRRTIFDHIGFFDTDLIRNQDDEFNARIIKNGGTIFLIPDIEIIYYSRDQISKVGQMFYQYGLFKPLVNKKLGSPASFRQFVPLLFVSGLFFGTLIGIFIKPVLGLTLVSILVYISISFGFSLIEIIKHRKLSLIFLPYIFTIIHISYGFGYLKGILLFLLFKNKHVSLNTNR